MVGTGGGGAGGFAGTGARTRPGARYRDLVAGPGPGPGHAVAALALSGIAAGFAWRAPAADGLAAGALVGALLIDAVGRLAVARAGRLAGIAVRLSRLPSLALPFGRAAGLGLLALALLACPRAFAPIAGAGAGLIAIGGLARLALARTLAAAAKAERRNPSTGHEPA